MVVILQWIWLGFLNCLALGVALGIVGLCSKRRNRVTAVIGLSLHGLLLLLVALVVVVVAGSI